ncbi:AAA family ATPase [Paraclostridium bifermentans]|nr:AAA family ATPase [Paraclostridium bifermentans]
MIFESKSIPYIEPNLWIKSISIKDTVVTNNLKVQLNPQMNTIIGGRGSGKSSILKFILGCLYKNEELEKVKNISDNFDEFFNITKNAEYEFTGVLTTDTEIEIELNRDGIEYKIKCYNFEKNNRSVQYKTDIYSNGEEKKLDVDSKEFIKMISSNIEIYLQKTCI